MIEFFVIYFIVGIILAGLTVYKLGLLDGGYFDTDTDLYGISIAIILLWPAGVVLLVFHYLVVGVARVLGYVVDRR